MQNAYPSEVLFVLGMHRSGTSAATRVFNLLGYSAPKTLMKSNSANQKGHWESTPIARLNDGILHEANLIWSDWSQGNWAGLKSKDRANFQTDILATLSQEFPANRPAVVKDPRICRLLDLYRKALEAQEIPMQALIPVRNPLAVMESLKARNDMPETQSGLLWLRYMLDAMHHSNGLKRAFMSYEALLNDPISSVGTLIDALGMNTPYQLDTVDEQISDFLSSDLNNHSFSSVDVAHNRNTEGWINEAYEAFLVLCKDPTSKSAIERLTELRVQLNQANDILTTVSVSYQELSDAQRIENESLLAELQAKDAKTDELESELASLSTQLQTTRKSLLVAEHDHDELMKSLQVKDTELNDYRDKITATDEHLLSVNAELAEVKRQFESSRKDNDALEAQLTDAQQAHAELETQFTAAQEAHEEELHHRQALEAQLVDAQASLEKEMDQLSRRFRAQMDSAISEKADELARVKTGLDKSNRELLKANSSIEEILPRLKSREKELRQLERQFWRLKDELNWSKEIVQSYETSTSWKVSAPLRSAVRIVRKLTSGSKGLSYSAAADAPRPKASAEDDKNMKEPDPAGDLAISVSRSSKVATKGVQAPKTRDLVRDIALLEQSKAFDKAYYLAQYPESQLYLSGPEGHYLSEGWKLGHRPNPTFETKAYIAAHPEVKILDVCPLIHFIETESSSLRSKSSGLNGANGADKHKAGRIAVFTAISNGYDNLKEPEFVSENADYFVFTDGDIPAYSIWKPLPFEFVSHDPTRTARFVKTHPHLYFQDYDWAIWVDANLQLATFPESLLPSKADDADFLTWSHPLRDCIYQEAEECMKRHKDSDSTIQKQMKSMRDRRFPEQAGLYETSVIVSKMNNPKVADMLNIWWAEINKWSKRDQLSLPFAIKKSDLKVGLLAREKICMRTDPRFVYYRHAAQ